MAIDIGIIGGSGLYDMAELTDREERVITTPFGDPSGPYVVATLRGKHDAPVALACTGLPATQQWFTTQLAALGMLVVALAKFHSADAERERGLVHRLLGIPSLIESTLALDGTIRELAKRFADVDEWQTEMQLKSLRAGRVQLYTTGLDDEERRLNLYATTTADSVLDFVQRLDGGLVRYPLKN